MDNDEIIKLFCKNKKIEYLSHREAGDGFVYILVKHEIRTTYREIEPYATMQKLKDSDRKCDPSLYVGKWNV